MILLLCMTDDKRGHFVRGKADKYGIDPANLPVLNTTINIDTNSPTRCSPVFACEGYDILSVPYLAEHVLPSFMQETKTTIHDTKKTCECLRKKHLLLLGDATMAEVFHDLAILMSGLSLNNHLRRVISYTIDQASISNIMYSRTCMKILIKYCILAFFHILAGLAKSYKDGLLDAYIKRASKKEKGDERGTWR